MKTGDNMEAWIFKNGKAIPLDEYENEVQK